MRVKEYFRLPNNKLPSFCEDIKMQFWHFCAKAHVTKILKSAKVHVMFNLTLKIFKNSGKFVRNRFMQRCPMSMQIFINKDQARVKHITQYKTIKKLSRIDLLKFKSFPCFVVCNLKCANKFSNKLKLLLKLITSYVRVFVPVDWAATMKFWLKFA